MKAKILTLSVCAAGAIALIGAGFSSWYFAGTDDVTTTSGYSPYTVVTKAESDKGDIKVDSSDVYLELDQGGVDNASDVEKGISFKSKSGETYSEDNDTAATTLTATWTISGDEYKMLTATDSKYTVTYSATLELNSKLAAYIELPTSEDISTSTDEDTQAVSYTIKCTSNLSESLTAESDNSNSYKVTVTLTLPTFQYKSGQKPLTMSAYNTMIGNLNSSDNDTSDGTEVENLLTVNFTVSVAETTDNTEPTD